MQPDKKHANKDNRTSSTLLGALLPVLAGIAAMGALLFFHHLESSRQHSQEQAATWAAAYNQQLGTLAGLIDHDSKALADSMALVRAVQQRDREQIRQLERQMVRRAYLVTAVVRLPGQPASRNDSPDIGFAALDHIGQAATNQPGHTEYVQSNQHKLLYKAQPILEPSQQRVIGTLLLAYDADRMLGSLPEPNIIGAWQIRLLQQLPNVPEVVMHQAGPGLQKATPVSFAGPHPYWRVELGIDSLPIQHSPWLMHYVALLLISLLGALLALLVQRGRMRRNLAEDAELLQQAFQTGNQDLLDRLAHRELRPLKPALQQLLLKAAKPATAAPAAPAPKAEPAPAQTILDEALEIDILDMELDDSEDSPQPLDTGIFRAYDIRGIVGQNLDADTAYWVGRAVGSESRARGESSVVVGRDGRLSGPALLKALAQGLADSGCEVLDLGMVPTPLVYFATHRLAATSGVMVTGSHNPPDYNGFKIVIAGETLSGPRITALYERIVSGDLMQGSGSVHQEDIIEQYVGYISDDIAIGRPLKVVVDCGNGVGGTVAPQLLESIGCSVVPLYCEVDGNFPNHHPDPGKAENLQDLIRRVREENADLGLAFDGDADRVGVVTNTGEIIYSDRLMMLLAEDVISRNPGADIVFDVKCSRRLGALISRVGGRPVMWKTGHSLMKAKIRETGALLGGEMSGHIFFGERWFGFDDGIYAAARLLETLSMESDSVDRVFARYPLGVSTPELTIEVTEDTKFGIIETLQASADWGNGSVNTLDGIRVDYPGGWGLIRASNTTPLLVLRFEGDSEEELQRIQELFREQLLAAAPDIHWPF